MDELGPLAVKTYPGEEWKLGPERASGQGELLFSDHRDSPSHLKLLEQIVTQFPAERWLIIEDNLSIHTSRQVQMALLAWPELQVQFIPKYACWLNLIEPWWKQLRSLALKGRRFETPEELMTSLQEALEYWNQHKRPYSWKKLPQEQPRVLLGGIRPELEHITIHA